MRAMLRLAFFTSLFAATSSLAQEFDDARTIDACRKVYAASSKNMPTAAMRGIGADYGRCTKRAMNAEVDRMLVPLKRSDAARFKAGMALQKTFNQAVQRYCGRWEPYYERCCSTCSFNEQPECEADFHAARVALARNEMKTNDGTVSEPVKTGFSAFAAAWCTFTAGNDDCSTRVLALITATQRDDGRQLTCR